MIVSDRISAFDVILPKRGFPYKGQVLNQIASDFLMQLLILFQTGKWPCQIQWLPLENSVILILLNDH